MDFAYSPHRETGGTMHLPSPTHHGYRLDGTHFSSIQQLRQSLSRSPSKPSRFQLRTGKANSPASPISPLALARAFSPKPHKPPSPTATYPESPLASQAVSTTKKRFTLRRSAPFRSSPRNRASNNKSPRRALVDSSDLGNSTPFLSRPSVGQENTPARKTTPEHLDKLSPEGKQFEINDTPIKLDFGRSRPDSNAPGANVMIPPKSSPLKRNDGLMNLNSEHGSSPVAKRRSLHGASSLGADFDIFNQSPAPRTSIDEPQRSHSNDENNSFVFSSSINSTQSPVRRTASLRKSTMSQRFGTSTPRPKPSYDGEFVRPGAAASKTRNRMSLDSSLGYGSSVMQSPAPYRTPTADAEYAPVFPSMRGGAGAPPHPLTNSMTASSLSPGTPVGSPAPAIAPTAAPEPGHSFAKSLPIGASRPTNMQGLPVGTPFVVRAEPAPATTGLMSKKNRNVDDSPSGKFVMPGTPSKELSKRMSYPPTLLDRVAVEDSTMDTPFGKRSRSSLFGNISQPQFGRPSTPMSTHPSKRTTGSFGASGNIFGSFGNNHQRRSSFASIDGDDNSHSPSGNHMTDSQSSADDLPPTPTKGHDGSGRRSKESSLRRKTFRQRPSLGTETFANPELPTVDISTAPAMQNVTTPLIASSPHTPGEPIVPPDPSRLSISGHRRGSVPFNSSINSCLTPATPTTPRELSHFFSSTRSDVDESLSSRFREVKLLDGNEGEFSQVFRVSKPISDNTRFSSPPGSRVFVVKKSKKAYLGASDRGRKMREVDILYALRGSDHVVEIKDHWEESGHLYIQTEYCEGGNLRKFLNSAGYDSRLDDFRIWKILLELSLGLKYIHDHNFIHLDLKPANILIDFEGVLKIGDFGLASSWPAPPHIDGEGDRHYLAPEALRGCFDKPADVFALGMMLAEIAGNCVIPENGEYWQKLRSGEFQNVLPSLTWSANSSTLSRDSNGDPIPEYANRSTENLLMSDAGGDSMSSLHINPVTSPEEELAKAPRFMVDEFDENSMDNVAKAMMHPDPNQRPTAEQVYRCFGCQWVESRRRAGATIYEGNFGPSEDVLRFNEPHDIETADRMDMS